ncbi:helix-turn-helix domain-containing protein [Gilliamella apis]|uniref:helix-turn-helix domain-containing protein n=1 Tax=Gilliamella apis TaxID=1970738 RepID=UPI00242A3754|nr:AraC family transcriptional regulator [Gilliamella apis]
MESNLTFYLPSSNDKYLAPILKELELDPANNKTLEQWAQTVFTTERTLARRCQQKLGMSFRMWRQRLRFLYSISLLKQDKSIQDIAFSVGYSSVSVLLLCLKISQELHLIFTVLTQVLRKVKHNKLSLFEKSMNEYGLKKGVIYTPI